jgi:hypothetical protein
MEIDGTTVVLGIPVPSTDPVFLTIVGVHVLFGLAATGTGAAAMVSAKGRGRHSRAGTFYFWCLCGVFLTMSALSVMRWRESYHLFVLGIIAFGAACLGRIASGRYEPRWLRLHMAAMGVSYVVMLTAFYVDNGKNLPLWRELPPLAFWLLPGAVGLPLVIYTWIRHPLILSAARPGTSHSADPK